MEPATFSLGSENINNANSHARIHGQQPGWSGLIVIRREDHFDFQ
jgi:hypothetical protein